MAFILEDGTGITGANALVSVAELTDYLTDRNDTTVYTDEQKQAAIIESSVDYIDTYFKIKGTPLTETQGMQIPTDEVGLVAKIKQAAYRGAQLSLIGRLFVDPSSIQSQAVTGTSSKVASLSKSVEYADTNTYTTKYPTNSIDMLMKPYVDNGGGMGELRVG